MSEGREDRRCPPNFAVDPDEQILVERGGYAERIVLGELKVRAGLTRSAPSSRQSPVRARGGCAQETRLPPAYPSCRGWSRGGGRASGRYRRAPGRATETHLSR